MSVDLHKHKKVRIILIALFSKNYPMVCETHGVSVLAGVLKNKLGDFIEDLKVLDLYALGSLQNDYTLLKSIVEFQPDVIGISVPYGSFSYLKEIYPEIKQLIINREHIVIFGGAIPTYVPKIFLNDIDESAIIVRGEGEDAIERVIYNWIHDRNWSGIPNICYYMDNKVECNDKSLTDLSLIPPPYREHMVDLSKGNAQIFVELSRGCSWGRCTFCPRGLMDIEGHPGEYRYFPFERLEQDIIRLFELGIRDITFADEDFLGGNLAENQQFVNSFERLICESKLDIHFDVSMTVKSIYSHKRDNENNQKQEQSIKQLKKLGLRKVFLGLESGSESQLKRYNKGNTIYEAIKAARILQNAGVDIELGFIMFDPLCTIDEVRENAYYLKNNELARYVSSLGSNLELRIQLGSRYLTMLRKFEQDKGKKLFIEELDIDTLRYPSLYLNSDVSDLVSTVKNWNSMIRPIYYPLKSLSRYGRRGSSEELYFPIRDIVGDVRETYLNWILTAVDSIELNGNVAKSVLDHSRQDIKGFCKRVIGIFAGAPRFVANSQIVDSLLKAAHEFS